MAQKDRSKELWLIPKRVNLHQSICVVEGIIARNYDGTTWNPNKQNTLGVNLKNWGATKSGKNISPQAIRTLIASIPQYLGFVYIDTKTTPSTINVTDAGKELLSFHKNDLVKIRNLVDDDDKTVKTSSIVLKQFKKLQITNPILLKDCENVYVFPFVFTLNLLLDLKYLDKEEIAYFLLRCKEQNEIPLIIQEIKNFRKLSQLERNHIMELYKETHHGNITLVQAPTSNYYISLCETSGIISKINVKPENKEDSINAIKIKDDSIELAKSIVDEYKNIETFDFKNDLHLWIDYIGNPKHKYPPFINTINNLSNYSFLVQIACGNKEIASDEIKAKSSFTFPAFENDHIVISIYNPTTGNKIRDINYIAKSDNPIINLNENNGTSTENLSDLIDEIKDHCSRQYFSLKMEKKLKLINKVFGVDRETDKSLRGAYLEMLVYKSIELLKKNSIIDDVIWNGKIGKYGLPIQAPGGKYGIPDLVVKTGEITFIFELTTIASKSLQYSAEGASVPDHIKIYSTEHPSESVVGVFSAPKMHDRVNTTMKTIATQNGQKLLCISIDQLCELLSKKSHKDFLDYLNNI